MISPRFLSPNAQAKLATIEAVLPAEHEGGDVPVTDVRDLLVSGSTGRLRLQDPHRSVTPTVARGKKAKGE